jgi:hypothetical protein
MLGAWLLKPSTSFQPKLVQPKHLAFANDSFITTSSNTTSTMIVIQTNSFQNKINYIMQTLQIDKANARKLFPTASPEFKQMLLDTFGEKFFNQKITDRVKIFEDACEVLGLFPNAVAQDDDTIDEAAYKKLKVIAKALNEGWQPDWSNENQYKHYPYFKMSGFGFSRTRVTFAGARYGCRLSPLL